MSWYQGKFSYQREQENGSLKNLSETYLLEALSYTDAEARMYEIAEENAIRDYAIKALTPIKLSDIFHEEEGEYWYMVKMYYISMDEVRGTEKKIVSQMLLNAADIKQAIERIHENLKTLLVPYIIEAVKQTPILEVYPKSTPPDSPRG